MTQVASLDDAASREILLDAARRIQEAKHSIFVIGAGVSTGEGAKIPDFRGAKGLFSTSAVAGQGVKELFHIKCLSSIELLPLHHALMNSLAEMAQVAKPTSFHRLMKSLDERGQLLRCYTQNIDGLEAKAGLETGLPHSVSAPSPVKLHAGPSTPRKALHTPRCIPLHGILSTLHCTLCSTTCPLIDYLPLPSGPLPCPTCALDTALRIALHERQRQAGQLRASVVLYGESHPSGNLIGSVLEKDLRQSSHADLLVVAGTSLVIPGIKRMVKELAKALRARYSTKIRSILINREPPPADLEGVFDLWIQGDVQEFVESYVGELDAVGPPTPRKTPSKSKAGIMEAEVGLERVFTTPIKKAVSSAMRTPSTPMTPKSAKAVKSAIKVTPKKTKSVKTPSYLPTPGDTPPSRKRQTSVLDTPSKKPKRARAYSTGSDSSLTSLDDC